MSAKNKSLQTTHYKLQTLFLGKDRDYFVENISLLVASGMGIIQALEAVGREIHSRALRRVVRRLKDEIESGSPLWQALSRARLFSADTISLVRIGEESGKLAANLKVVSEQQEKKRSFRSKIRSAMMYPLLVLSLTIVIGAGVGWFILPRLATVFSQLHITLPLLTRSLIQVGVFFDDYGRVVVPGGLVGIGLVFYIIFFVPALKRIGQRLIFSLPGVKRLIREVEIARFSYLLGTLLQAGLPVTEALQSVADATSFSFYKKFYAHLAVSIDEGNSFQKSFLSYPRLQRLVPSPVQQLVVTGEQSGNLSETLLKISATFEAKTETTTKNLTVILEPVLLVIVWLGVLAVALAVILPIYSLVGELN